MKIPNSENAFIPLRKLTDYLLSDIHEVGKSKAKFFQSFGFNKINANSLREELLKLVRTYDVSNVVQSEYGIKYTVEGEIQTPYGAAINLKTVWVINRGDNVPRFVTAYPS